MQAWSADGIEYTMTQTLLDQLREMTVVVADRSEEHTSELQSRQYLVCRLLLEKKKKVKKKKTHSLISTSKFHDTRDVEAMTELHCMHVHS